MVGSVGKRRAAVAVELRYSATRARDSSGYCTPGKLPYRLREAAVLGVDHDDVLDLRLQRAVEREIGGGLGRRGLRFEQIAAAERQARETHARGEQPPPRGVRRRVAAVVDECFGGKVVTRIVVLAHRWLLALVTCRTQLPGRAAARAKHYRQ